MKAVFVSRAVKPTVIPKYEPTLRDREMMAAYFARKNAPKPSPRDGHPQERVAEIAVAHPRPDVAQSLCMEAIGTADLDFLNGLIRQLANAGGQGTVQERDLNFMLAIVKGIEPRDQIEAMLAAQMAAVHNATMTFAGRLNRVDNIQQQDSAACFQ